MRRLKIAGARFRKRRKNFPFCHTNWLTPNYWKSKSVFWQFSVAQMRRKFPILLGNPASFTSKTKTAQQDSR